MPKKVTFSSLINTIEKRVDSFLRNDEQHSPCRCWRINSSYDIPIVGRRHSCNVHHGRESNFIKRHSDDDAHFSPGRIKEITIRSPIGIDITEAITTKVILSHLPCKIGVVVAEKEDVVPHRVPWRSGFGGCGSSMPTGSQDDGIYLYIYIYINETPIGLDI